MGDGNGTVLMITQPHNNDAHDALLEAIHESATWLWTVTTRFDNLGHAQFIHKLLEGVATQFDLHPVQHAEWLMECLGKDGGDGLTFPLSYPHLLRNSCIGVTQRGTRCSKPGTVIGKSGQAYCSQHLDEVPAVWSSITHLLEIAGYQLQFRTAAAKRLAEPALGGSVYFLWDQTKYMKIGHTDRLPSVRVDEIAKDRGRSILAPEDVNWYRIELIDSVGGTKKTENTMHSVAHEWRVEGEWFKVCPELVFALQSVGVDLHYLLDDIRRLRHAS